MAATARYVSFSQVGTAYSHGCIRLTNCDAEDLAAMVKPGTKVMFKDEAGLASQ